MKNIQNIKHFLLFLTQHTPMILHLSPQEPGCIRGFTADFKLHRLFFFNFKVQLKLQILLMYITKHVLNAKELTTMADISLHKLT